MENTSLSFEKYARHHCVTPTNRSILQHITFLFVTVHIFEMPLNFVELRHIFLSLRVWKIVSTC